MTQDERDYLAELEDMWRGMRRSRHRMWFFVFTAYTMIGVEAIWLSDPLVLRALIVGALLVGSIVEIVAIIENRMRETASRLSWRFSQEANAMQAMCLEQWIDHQVECHRPT